MSEKKKRILKRVKKGFTVAYGIWQAIVVTVIAIVLIPVFLANAENGNFYSWVITASLLTYVVVLLIMGKLKRGIVREYLEKTSFRLFLGMVVLTAAFLLHGLGQATLTQAALAAAAVLYAFFLQRITFLRLIGL